MGLANEKYILQIAVVYVSAKCSPDNGECANFMSFPSVLTAVKCFKFSRQARVVFLKCCEFCTEAIDARLINTFSGGRAPKTTGFFMVICILQFSLILEYSSYF